MIRVRGDRSLRLLPLSLALLLGLSPLSALRERRDPDRLRARPGKCSEREVAREMLERVPLAGLTVIADKGFAGAEFEGWMADRGAEFLRPDRKDEPLQFGSLGRVRQWIESVFWTCKGQLGLERHGVRTLPGLCARVGLRLLALAAGLRHNAEIGQPGLCFSARSEEHTS